MSSHIPRSLAALPLVPSLAALLLAGASGCGSSEQSTEQWETASPTTAQQQFVIDSLANENRRIKQQLEAMAIENRKITARNAELETKLSEAAAVPTAKATPSPKAAPAAKPTPPPKATPAPKSVAGAPPVKAQSEQPAQPRPTTPAADFTSQYSDALQTYRNRNFSGAAEQFETLLKSGIGEDLAGHCHYWIGQSYYDMKKYKEAIPHFQSVLDMRKSEKKPDAQLMLANCYLELGNAVSAKQEYQKFLSTYPNSPNAKKARDRLLRLKG